MTKKLYWESPYETKFIAKVESIVEDGIELDRTLFYPESGNQLSDRGLLKIKEDEFKIENVSKRGDNIIHHISDNFKNKVNIGDEVQGEIDWQYRYGLMRAHSSQHVFSAVLKSKYDIDTVRANLNFEEVYLQWSQKVDPSQLKEILFKVNTICTSEGLNITSRIVPQKETESFASEIRSKIPNEPQIRLMEIQNLDLVCCGGTHVRTSNEIGYLFIYDFKKGNEIRYYVGNKAISMVSNVNIDLMTVVSEFNSSLEKFRENLIKRFNSLKNLQSEQKELSKKLLELTSKLPSKTINTIPLFYIDFDIDIKILNKMLDIFPENAILVLNIGNNKVRLLSKSEKIDANQLLTKLIDRYEGKGGGNPNSAQGVLKSMPESLLSDVENLLRRMKCSPLYGHNP
ncbi:MAG: alanine--tRNA ligase-related protein [Candidatus Hodarchaeales archaeon]|jgi:alanyl-tRNA synthetase